MFEAWHNSLKILDMNIHITVKCIMSNFLRINENIGNLFFHLWSYIDLNESLSFSLENGFALSILEETKLRHLQFEEYFVIDCR